MEKLLIIDGNSILNRAYYGIRPLTAPDGTPTNAVYGFLNILFKHIDEENPDYLCVAFDVKEKTFRHKMYDLYKAQRKPAPEDFLVQLPLMKQVLCAMNCLCIEKAGYEADDIIGTVSRLCNEKNIECKILTGDKDDLQLITDNTIIKLVITRMGKTETYDYGKAEFFEKYGIYPNQFIDAKALMGDSSDNIPGVKGIGEKTAMSLIQNYKSLDDIYSQIESLEVSDSVRKKLSEGKDDAYLSRRLATIDKFTPIDFDFSLAKTKEYNKKELAALFERLNFRSFMSKLELENQQKTLVISGESENISFDALLNLAEAAEKTFYIIDNNNLYVKFRNQAKALCAKELSKDNLISFLENERIAKIGFNVKEDLISLSDFGIEYKEIDLKNLLFDVFIAAYILDPSKPQYTLKELTGTYLNATLDGQAAESAQVSMFEETLQDMTPNVFAIEMLYEKFSALIEENNQHTLYYDVEIPLIKVLYDMQSRGMYIDKQALSDFGAMLNKRLLSIEEQIYSHSGEEFNINSPKQLGVVLFEKLELPFGKKNKSGGYSTNADILEKLKDKHPIIPEILEYRQLSKLMSTYVTGLSSVVNKKTGRIHSSFNQTVTQTGRISSTEPNMQNIPVRTELGREIRKMFISEKENWCLIDADYSQIELRVLAHIADDAQMKNAFESGEDIHAQTASNVFNVPLSKVTSSMRSRAKAVNFGIVYGIGAFSLAQDIKTTRKEAENYINEYLKYYSSVADYMKNTIENAKNLGYITTILNRRRYLQELKASSAMVRAFGERVAMNAPIQGSAADIIKIAMVNVYNRLKNEGLKARLILQVHDELIVECPETEREIASKILKEEMETAYPLSVPLKVDMNSGKSWYDTK